MKAFISRFLEPMNVDKPVDKDWTWQPHSNYDKKNELYASGNSTNSRESTYADERDNRPDQDRPNEGSLAA